MSKQERSMGERGVQTEHHRIEGLHVTGGFLAGERFDFVDGLNCLIGGRGAGKTTAFEFLRYGLGMMPEPGIAPQRVRGIEALVKANLGSGRTSVEIRTKMGMLYTADRGAADAVQVRNEVGAPAAISLDRNSFFGADVYSQNEVEEIASNAGAQLTLLDRFVQEEASGVERELAALRRQLEQTTVEMVHLDGEIEDVRAEASEVPIVAEKLKGFEIVSGPDATMLNQAHAASALRQREVMALDELLRASDQAVADTNAVVRAYAAMLASQFDEALVNGANRDVLAAVQIDARAVQQTIEDGATRVAAAVAEMHARTADNRTLLSQQHAFQEAAYRETLTQFEQEGGRQVERATLQSHMARAVGASKTLAAKEGERSKVAAARLTLLGQASELRDQLYRARTAVAERLTQTFGGGIRVTVDQAADVVAYKAILTDALRGAGIKQGPAAERLVEHFLPIELARAVQTRATDALVKAGFDEDRARRIAEILRGKAYEIELVELEDLPRIELRDGDVYKDSNELSTGQRCTAILPILLLQSERPLLIDQPEDNLDNAFIYETVVKALRSAKGRRQIIFVTHNPNIPVLGEAERIFVLESNGRKGTIRRAGTVDECKDDIETILEGGSEAFQKRKARYGY